MSALRLRRKLRRQRRGLAFIAAVAIAGSIVVHHSGLLMDMQPDSGMGAVVELCLGVFTTVGASLAAVVVGVVALGRRQPTPVGWPAAARCVPAAPDARARHGPQVASVLCVDRR